MRVIPDEATARRIGVETVAREDDALGFRPFQYEQPRTRLTLFGVVVIYADQHEREIRYQ